MHHLKFQPNHFRNNPNLGLLYYKFTPAIKKDNASRRRGMTKQEFLYQFCNLEPDKNIIDKRLSIINKYADRNLVMQNTSRFLCGIGYTSTLEWGLGFDWTSGMPYLPGSSFKGVLLSYLEFLQGNEVESESWTDVKTMAEILWTRENIFEIFGPQGKDIQNPHCGKVVFLDVYPINFNGFDVDIITPHYKKYYEDNQHRIPPDDTENPTPIPFLTLRPDSQFLFSYKIRGNIDERQKNELIKRMNNLIVEAGDNYGFGAKTTTGYGYFKFIKEMK